MKCLSLSNMKECAIEKASGQVWADLAAGEEGALQKFGIPAEDYTADSKRNYSRYIEREGRTAVVLFTLTPAASGLSRKRIIFYICKKGIVSVGATEIYGWFYNEFVRERGLKKSDAQEVLIEALSEIVKKHSATLLHFEEKVNRLESIAAEQKQPLGLSELFTLKRQLASLLRHLWREREIIYDFRNGHIQFAVPGKNAQQRLDDMFSALLFDMNTCESFKEVLSDVLDIHHTIVSNRINKSIEKLTVVTVWLAIVATIGAFPNTIATIFGIPYLPLDAKKEVFSILGFSVFPWELVAGSLIIFTLLPTLVLIGWWKKVSEKEQAA